MNRVATICCSYPMHSFQQPMSPFPILHSWLTIQPASLPSKLLFACRPTLHTSSPLTLLYIVSIPPTTTLPFSSMLFAVQDREIKNRENGLVFWKRNFKNSPWLLKNYQIYSFFYFCEGSAPDNHTRQNAEIGQNIIQKLASRTPSPFPSFNCFSPIPSSQLLSPPFVY